MRKVLVPTPAFVLVALALFVAGPTRAWAQNPPAPAAPGSVGAFFVSAVDSKGEPVPDLGKDAFDVREDGEKREIVNVAVAQEPIDVVLILDNSAGAADRIAFIRSGAAKFVAALGPSSRVGIVTIGERPRMVLDFTADRQQIATALSALLPTSGEATILDTMIEISTAMANRNVLRAAIVPVITDASESSVRFSSDVVDKLRASGATLHLVTIGNKFAEGGRANEGKAQGARERSFFVEDGPKATNGQRVTVLNPTGLDGAMERLGREIAAQYRVVYSRPAGAKPVKKVEIKATNGGTKLHGLPVRRVAAPAR